MLAAATGVASAAEAIASRDLSLQDCVQMALEKNLDIRIERINPQLAQFNLAAARAGYQPSLSLSGEHSHDESGSRLLTGGFLIPGSTTDANSFSGSLGGSTPWGMSYSLGGKSGESYGKSFTIDTNNTLISLPFDSSQSSVELTLTQPLLKNFLIDGTRLGIAVAKNRLKYSELGLRGRIIEVITRVELAYYDLEFAHESVKVQQKALELAQRLLEENKKRVEVGALAPLDEKQSEAEVAGRQADLIAAQRNLDVLENNLKQLLSDNFSQWNSQRLVPSDSLAANREPLSLSDSWSKGLSLRPEYQQAKLDVEREGIQLKYDKNQVFPQLDVFASFGYNGSGVEFSDSLYEVSQRDRPFYSYGGQITIPLGNGAARNRYKNTKAAREQTLIGLKKLEQDIMIQIDNAIKLAQSNYERISATRKAREYAEAALAAEQKKLENGKSTSFVVLSLQRDLTAARSDEISALVQYKRSLALVAQADGTTLERRKVDLTVK
ncbi:MAG: Outer rane efflux protein BepC precursor [Verrucomicrobiota bacterium]